MKRSIQLASLVLLFSCAAPNPKAVIDEDSLTEWSKPVPFLGIKSSFSDPRFILEEHREKFAEERIVKFNEELFNKEKKLYAILGRASFDVFQDNAEVHHEISDHVPYYYAIQHTGSHTGIMIMQLTTEWMNYYTYMAYNNEGKLVGREVLAQWGGSCGEDVIATGEFINDSVYVRKTIASSTDPETGESTIERDMKEEIIIHYDGKIEVREL